MRGEVINNYRISSVLGQGGMGIVYLAEHSFMGRKAAVKVLRREFVEDTNVVERFMNEARAVNAIRHPNIIDIIDVGRLASGIPYLMMEFLEGETLAKRIARTRCLGVDDAVNVALQTADALGAAHGKGIVHRDLKPDNLFLLPDNTRPRADRVKVLDFGIAKLRGDMSISGSQTQRGALMGTPPYMSPEQCRGLSAEVDERSDVYSLGIILYEMLCGAPPFVSPGWGEMVLMHMTRTAESLRTVNAQVPEVIDAIVLKALAKDPKQRFQSMGDLQVALGDAWHPSRVEVGLGTAVPGGTLRLADGRPPVAATDGAHLESRPDRSDGGEVDRASVSASTTFKTASGEIGPSAMSAAGPGQRGLARRVSVFAGLVVVAAIVAGTVGLGARKTKPAVNSEVEPVAAASFRPALAVPVISPVRQEATRVSKDLPQVRIKLSSLPAGAAITDERTGELLGKTPFDGSFDQRPGVIDLRIEKPGFTSEQLSIPLDQDFEKVVSLKETRGASGDRANAPAKIQRAPVRLVAPVARKTSAPRDATSAPSVTVVPNAKPRAEKW